MYEYFHTLHIFEYKFSSCLSFALLSLNYSLHHLILYYFISIIYFSREPFLSYLTKLLHLIFFTHNPPFFHFLTLFLYHNLNLHMLSIFSLKEILHDLWNVIKEGTAVQTHYGSFRDKRERKRKSIFKEKMAETSQILGGKMDKETSKAQMIPNRISPNQITLRLIIIKLSKSRTKRILKVAIENIFAIYKRTPIILSANFSAKPHSPGESV